MFYCVTSIIICFSALSNRCIIIIIMLLMRKHTTHDVVSSILYPLSSYKNQTNRTTALLHTSTVAKYSTYGENTIYPILRISHLDFPAFFLFFYCIIDNALAYTTVYGVCVVPRTYALKVVIVTQDNTLSQHCFGKN
jgi:hypothetical protein